MRAMSFGRIAAVTLAVAALALAGRSSAAEGAVKVAKDPKIGSYLTDAKGMTLYVFKKDTPGQSACAGPCLGAWPVFYSEKVEPAGGPSAGDFATITRADGMKQTTYRGMPLYYFASDKKPGDVGGNGFKDLWTVAAP